jgi:hypothetical protein
MYYSDNLLIRPTAPTCFDVYTSSSGSLLLSVLLSYIKMCIVVLYAKKSLPSVVVINKIFKIQIVKSPGCNTDYICVFIFVLCLDGSIYICKDIQGNS